MKKTLKEAANLVGCNKSTLFRAVQKGRIPSIKCEETGVIHVNMKDVEKVYALSPVSPSKEESKKNKVTASKKTKKEDTKLKVYIQEIKDLTDQKEAQAVTISELMIEKEKLRSELTRVLKENEIAHMENKLKDKRMYELRRKHDEMTQKIETLEQAGSSALNTSAKDKKNTGGLLRKIFA